MERYTNRYLETKETHKELRFNMICWPLSLIFAISVMLMFGVLIVAGVFCIIREYSGWAIYSFILAAIQLVFGIKLFMNLTKYLKTPTQYGKADIRFHKDCIEIVTTNGTYSRQYGDLKRIKESKNFFILVLENEKNAVSYLPTKKGGFNCDDAEFKKFINEKLEHNGRKKVNDGN